MVFAFDDRAMAMACSMVYDFLLQPPYQHASGAYSPCDMLDGDPSSSLASAGFALPHLFLCEVTREVMVPPCEVTAQ
jgi:hypothetical protein